MCHSYIDIDEFLICLNVDFDRHNNHQIEKGSSVYSAKINFTIFSTQGVFAIGSHTHTRTMFKKKIQAFEAEHLHIVIAFIINVNDSNNNNNNV